MAFLLFPVLYFLLGVSHGSANSASTLLLAFKASLPNPNLLPTWTPARSPCSFSGVTCSSSSSAAAAVTAVTLSSLPLSLPFLSLSSSLLSLPSLQSLTLTSANLSGPLSPFPNCPPSLTSLNLAGNRLSGGLSDLAAACPSLASLNLSSNEIDGAGDVLLLLLPSGGGIRWLDLSGNRLSGEVPAVGNCSELRYLNLSSNHFSGKLPDDLSSCSNLESISLSNNNFSGELPVETLASMPNLRNLEFSFNNLTGFLPDSVSELSKLESIDLSSNGLSGNIPKSLCQNPNTNLGQLYLQNNQFTGAIPESLSNCSMLVSVDLSFNYLTGSIPRTLGSLSQLRDVIMWQNLLEGEIPGEIGLIKSLENLILDDNALTGSIPDGLSNCTSLNWISLSSNQLSGEIPPWIGSFGSLAILKLGNNSFSGGIPWELGDCKSLIWLDLNSNRLGGSIPGSLAKQSGNVAVGLVTGKRFVYLRNDGSKECRGAGNLLEFAGIRQDQLERLPSRRSCNFTRVYMGNTQYTFNNNGSMIFLDLSYNELGGEIPKELGEMYYLMVLNLGHNKLSGPIPPELGHLRYVGIFDLSYNSLQGPIPGSFSGLSLLSEIDLSNNKLNGTIPELGQLATFPSYRYENNSGLCGLPLPPCGEDTVSKSTGQHQKSRRRQASIVGSIALGLLLVVFCIFAVAIVIMENKKRERMGRANSSNSRDIYVDSRSHSGTANSNWKLTGTREALSISLATFDKPLRKLTFADLLEATNGFHDDSLIGSGGFGDVYKAQLKDGSVVAIKKLIHISSQGDREFMAEMETIGKIKHRNLVPLLGYCRVGEERLLVYEYMKYGSLEDVLHNRNKAGIKLNWAARRKIAVGAARGLAFLHHNCIPHIIHRDMKSSNVLIDENLEARVSDFGMARMMSAVDTHLSVSTLAGTPGYVPPEYYQSFRCTTKGDVYSYGVVLLELLTGKQPTDSSDFGDNNLVGWVKQHSKLRITDVFDRQLLKDDPKLELDLLEHLKIACACLDDRPARRPTMVKVMAMFKEIQAGSPVDSTDSVAAGSVDGTFGVAVEMSLKEAKEEKD